MHHASLSDEALLAQLASLCLEGRRLTARVIEHLLVVEDRGLHVKSACDSMWSFCTQRLGMSHGETSRRLHAAKLVRRFPSLLGCIERGEIHLSSLKILGRYLDDSNLDALLDAARGKSKLEVRELVARLFPRPDAPEVVREQSASSAQTALASLASLASPSLSTGGAPPSASAPLRNASIEPLSGTSCLVQMTLSKAGWEDLQCLKDLMGHRIPSGNTVEIVEAALKLLREKLEKERLGKLAKASRAPSKRRPSKPGRIAQATRREVFERDGMQCTFVDTEGRRCTSRTRLELDHVIPRAKGGSDEASNLRVTCRPHNLHLAEEVFGKDFVRDRIQGRQRHSPCVPAATASSVSPATANAAPVTHATTSLSPATVDAPTEAQPAAKTPLSTPAETFELAARGLVTLGFAKPDVKRALDIVAARRAGEIARVETLVRDAIQALT
ncbi:MAG: HNH endonuclease [Deltaproteobacteria bacterium]|nr:HNH endonuclease [Deltaproteobacteria bacterium]